MKNFSIPSYYKGSFIGYVKSLQKQNDPKKKKFSPIRLDFGVGSFLLPRHFGFCYGVENAIEIIYTCLQENPGKPIYLLSEMIHNPIVNQDLQSQGIFFLQDTYGRQLIDWQILQDGDIVIIPAFGTSLEVERLLKKLPVKIISYNTTCPFVERVWNKAEKLSHENYTLILHGKYQHEETRATFSRAAQHSPVVIVRDQTEAAALARYIAAPDETFYDFFEGKHSAGFDIYKDLNRLAVINQTTMLAQETKEITDFLKNCLQTRYPNDPIQLHYADTRDTLCYATNDNQTAAYALLDNSIDLAVVIGGYNSSNTTNLAHLFRSKCPTYFIEKSDNIRGNAISHFDFIDKVTKNQNNFIDLGAHPTIALAAGASCPDAVIEQVIIQILKLFEIYGTEEIKILLD